MLQQIYLQQLARLTAVLVLLAAGRWNGRGLRDQARLAPSPNSGWPMAAMARVLGVRLGKPGVYELNAGARAPAREDLHRACRIGMAVAWAAAVLAALACGLGWR